MKQLFYFIILLAGFSSIHSCKDLLDEDGNPLLYLNNNNGFNGPRALFREITDSDTIAEYHYNGLLLSKVLTDSASVTNVMWSGDKISQITFNGFLDLDGNGKLDKDSISFTQLFTYGTAGKLITISENRANYRRLPPVPPATIGVKQLFSRTKYLYNLKYSTATSKLDSIIMRNGPDVSGVPFAYSKYSKSAYTYLGDNVSKVVRHYGNVNANVFAPPTERYSYEFLNYDSQISAYTLLPFAYKVSMLLSTKSRDNRSMILSPNSPKRLSITDLTTPVPAPVIFSTDYNYDAQTYVLKGFGINYIYKPL